MSTIAWSATVSSGGSEWTFDASQMVEPPTFRVESRLTVGSEPERALDGRAEIALAHGDLAESLCSRFAATMEAFSLAISGDSESLWRGALTRIVRSPRGVRLLGSAGYPSAQALVCRHYPRISPAASTPTPAILPRLYGVNELMPPALFALERAVLDEKLGLTSKSLRLRHATGWPVAGRLQINDEVIVYPVSSEGGAVLGSAAAPLGRATPREHAAGSAVYLLPAGALQWCLADHQAAALAVRTEDADGTMQPLGSAAMIALGGRDALVYTHQSLPIHVTPGRATKPVAVGRLAPEWETMSDHQNPQWAGFINDRAPSSGAQLRGNQVIHLAYRGAAHTTEDRHSPIIGTKVRFDFADTPNWLPTTRLRLRVERGVYTREVDISRDGHPYPLAVQATVPLPAPPKSAPTTEWHVVPMDRVVDAGGWADAEHCVDANTARASTIAAGQPGTLRVRRTLPIHPERPARTVRLRALVYTSGTGSAEVLMAVSGTVTRQEWRTVSGVEDTLLTMEVALAEATVLEQIDVALTPPTGNPVGLSVRAVWVEFESEIPAPPAGSWPGGKSVLDVVGSTESIRYFYQSVEVDVSEMLGAGENLQFLADPAQPFTLRLSVHSPPPGDWWTWVRGCHLDLLTVPPAGLRPTERLWARVEGLLSESDGAANPAEVLAEILTSPHLGRIDSDDMDAASVEEAVEESAARGLRFRRLIVDATTTVGALMGQALAQSALALHWHLGHWRVAAMALDRDGRWPTPITGEELLEPTFDEELDRPLATARIARPSWLVHTPPELAGFWRDHDLPARHALRIDSPAAALMLPMDGQVVASLAGVGWGGDLAIRVWTGARAECQLGRVMRRRVLFAGGDFAVVHSVDTGVVVIHHAGRAIALLGGDGSLRLAGALHESVLPPVLAGGWAAVVEGHLALFAGTGITGWLRIDTLGNVETSAMVSESVAITGMAAAGQAWVTGAGLLLGGEPGGPPAMQLGPTALLLRGAIRTHSIF